MTVKKTTRKKTSARKTKTKKVETRSIMDKRSAVLTLLRKNRKNGISIAAIKDEVGICRKSVFKLLADLEAVNVSRGLYADQ